MVTSWGTKPRCRPTASTPSSRAKSAISFISASRAARVARRHEPHGLSHGRDIGIAFALEAAENHADADAQQLQPGQKLVGVVFGAGRLVRGMELDRWHAQFMGHFQFHAQTGVDAGKNAQRPLVHGRFSLVVQASRLHGLERHAARIPVAGETPAPQVLSRRWYSS